LNVSEIFLSLQGEGLLAGVASGFIRLAGCDLRCRWCDTPHALEAGKGSKLSVEEIVARVSGFGVAHAVVTGGEPLIWPELPGLLTGLKERELHVTLETSATQYRPVVCDLASLSPKLSHSIPVGGVHAEVHKNRRLNLPAIQEFIDHHDYQLKFVVRKEGDLAEVEQILAGLAHVNRERVLLMPQARTKAQLRRYGPAVAWMCIKHNFRYCPRLQLELWGRGKGH